MGIPINNFVLLYRHSSYNPTFQELYFQDLKSMVIAFIKLDKLGFNAIGFGLNEQAADALTQQENTNGRV